VPNFESNDCNGNVRALERRDFLVRWGKRLFCLALLGALGFGACRGYGVWRTDHLTRQAQAFASRGEVQSAVLVARRLLVIDGDNVAACRIMAEMAEKSGQREAIAWRQRVVSLEPGKGKNKVELAAAALRFGQARMAEEALSSIPSDSRNNLPFHQTAGAVAILKADPALAERHFVKAQKLEPGNPRHLLNLASIRLAMRSSEHAETARIDLRQLVADQPAFRLEALRALISDALSRQETVTAGWWAALLKKEPEITFADRLLYLQAVEGDERAVALNDLKAAAVSAETAAALITWLNRHEQAQAAAEWSLSLPKSIAESHPVPLAIAESYSYLQDWPALHRFVEGKNWGDFESFRLAVESHALHRLGVSDQQSMETETVWRAALKAAQKKPEQLVAIAQLAEGWGYKRDAEDAWWMVANGSRNAKMGLSALQRIYKQNQDTRGLMRVAKRALELNPGDLVAANNCASFGLLLNGDSTSRRLAAKLHANHPANRAFAATHAFGLHTEGKLAEGLRVMETLKDRELRHPSIAAYYVVMLVDNGKLERARSFLTEAKRAVLLPEEEQLLSAAARKLITSETEDTAKRVAQSQG